ncbi:XRE family transcriptional regulator [Lentibacillus lipolyticus]|nr:XRE family transcriptional regulator [Lentibacillus lipolyticus]
MDNEQLLMHFGEQLRHYRKQNDLTIQELAEKLDISNNHLGRIERGVSDTTITKFYRMVKILDIPCHFLDEMKQIVQDQNK